MMRPAATFLIHMATSVAIALAALGAPGALASVEVNTATEAELDGVKGLGPSSTARILTARANGPFRDWADFMRRVKGIKPTKAEQLSRDGLTVNEQPFRESER